VDSRLPERRGYRRESAMTEQFQIGPETTFGEFVKHKAETVGD
jgi:hypothetical protein